MRTVHNVSVLKNIQHKSYSRSNNNANVTITEVDLDKTILFHSAKHAHGMCNANNSAHLSSSTNIALKSEGTYSNQNNGNSYQEVVEYN